MLCISGRLLTIFANILWDLKVTTFSNQFLFSRVVSQSILVQPELVQQASAKPCLVAKNDLSVTISGFHNIPKAHLIDISFIKRFISFNFGETLLAGKAYSIEQFF